MLSAALALALLIALPVAASGERGVPPEQYGQVIIDNYSRQKKIEPVVFDHWLHRAFYTCRACHVDVGFAMEAGGTNITAATNAEGYYCGACHNGRYEFRGKKVFASCSEEYLLEDLPRCYRCHSLGRDDVKRGYSFKSFIKGFPKRPMGNGVDWEAAEEKGIITPLDYIEGVSIKRPPLKPQDDFAIKSRGTWMSDVIFSHRKHAFWNGCEVCHPEIFPSVKKGDVKYTMLEIFDGSYCGACHEKVAFSLYDCKRCHTKPVE